MIWNPAAEAVPLKERQSLQLERLRRIVDLAYHRVPFYRKSLDRIKLKPGHIKTLKDIEKLPFTTKDDLREGYPFGMFAVKLEEIVEFHTSSGTTGKPIVTGYTRGDIELWSEVMARALTMAGAGPQSIIQNAYGYGLFTGGLGTHYGARKIGAALVPISAGNTARQLQVMQDFGTTLLACTPSYSLYLAETAEEQAGGLRRLKLKSGCFGAEMWTERMRDEIERRLHLKALNIYGLTEVIGPGVAQECLRQSGLHIAEDHFFPEIISPETLRTCPEGESGELVLTTLTREGTPILRFRTKDITSLHREDCKCGRNSIKMARITGRSDDMLKVRGVLFFPSQIEKALLEIKGVEPHYQIILTRPHQLDEIEIQVETTRHIFSDEIKRLEELRSQIEKHLEHAINLRVKVTLVEPKKLPRSEGKAKRIVDNRQM
ncbi:MAG TPA: phenylacetate--CoA ligase [bacterium]|uniref:Phenylacetate-coenzyme A ligase n=1 Tax=candidate division TA06 bacterium ADurb.Bin417 TaxID=1852828 RepID=A0A1V5MFH6_UNCT6|nr:MAG: Phenylacetate-coenzyme A ligase [candidate division TA06 bacterium ADurb.Bin417]HNQ35189.1 phenylacetate--CoA ligase [bacterium]HNS48442.1 phenylacetate--CoA ligase [bacterium]